MVARLTDVEVLHDGDEPVNGARPSVVAIGVFDGLHRGHQRVLHDVGQMARASGGVATVITFDPHPALVLNPAADTRLLATLDQRLEGLASLGIERVRVLGFDEVLAQESAAAFVERVLVRELGTSDVVVGTDFRFGHDRRGDVALLETAGQRLNFRVHPAPVYGGTQRWSSTAVRQHLGAGEIASATAILGRPFVLRACVVRGDARGASLGYPTANVESAQRQQLPNVGIYAGAARGADGRWWPAAISLGRRPQFYVDGALLVEIHLIGFAGDLYGEVLDVAFLARLRAEATFPDVAALVAQMKGDVADSLEVYSQFSPETSTLLG